MFWAKRVVQTERRQGRLGKCYTVSVERDDFNVLRVPAIVQGNSRYQAKTLRKAPWQ